MGRVSLCEFAKTLSCQPFLVRYYTNILYF